jgi:hypothetical protein
MKPVNIFLALIFVIPCVIVSVPRIPPPSARIIATSIFVFSCTVGIFWYGLSSKTKMILASGKLSRPEYDDVRPKIEKNIRILVGLFGAFFCYYITVPFSIDLARLVAGETPLRITGIVRSRSVRLFGLWQSVRIAPEARAKYYLYYSWRPLRVGEEYELFVLPHSRVIVEFHEH